MQNTCTLIFHFNPYTILSGRGGLSPSPTDQAKVVVIRPVSSDERWRQKWIPDSVGILALCAAFRLRNRTFVESRLKFHLPCLLPALCLESLGCPRPAHSKPGCVWGAPCPPGRVSLLGSVAPNYFTPCVMGNLPRQRFQHTSHTSGLLFNSTSIHRAGSLLGFWFAF